jgi:hydroxymethylbilane synthase
MKRRTFIVATRRSELALAQCRAYLAELRAQVPDVTFEELHVVTTGDRIVDRPLSEVGGKGLFLKEIEEALFERRADFAVHSLKDVPPELHPDLTIGCIPRREDARDAVVTFDGRRLDELPLGARLGTSSLRRALQVRLIRPDLEIVSIRGNVGTRIRKCRDREVDATILAQAGANRLGVTHELSHTLTTEDCLPAVGQGALGIELRADNAEARDLIRTLTDMDTSIATAAERGVLAAVEGDCKTPVAAYGVREGDELWLRALLARPDESGLVRLALRRKFPATPEQAAELGHELGTELRAKVSATG